LPLYPYRCTACGHRFEKIQSFDADPLTECPKCAGALERTLTAPGLHFKGSGWYVNDYASGASKSSAASEKKSESKAETACSGGCSSCPMATPSSTS
jgi:putative FmdB family regulatory protein